MDSVFSVCFGFGEEFKANALTEAREEIASELEHQRVALQDKEKELDVLTNELTAKAEGIAKTKKEVDDLAISLSEAEKTAKDQEATLASKKAELGTLDEQLKSKGAEIEKKAKALAENETSFAAKENSLNEQKSAVESKERELASMDEQLKSREAALETKQKEADSLLEEAEAKKAELEAKEAKLDVLSKELDNRESALEVKEKSLVDKEKSLAEKEKADEKKKEPESTTEEVEKPAEEEEKLVVDGEETKGEESEKEKRLRWIDENLKAIIKQVEDEELEEEMEPEAVEALEKAAKKVTYTKMFYDVMKDELIYFPTVQSTIVRYDLMEEAEKYYFDEEDEFPMQYSASLRSVVTAKMAADGEEGLDEEYMGKLALDVEI